jgi:hypothetical protein
VARLRLPGRLLQPLPAAFSLWPAQSSPVPSPDRVYSILLRSLARGSALWIVSPMMDGLAWHPLAWRREGEASTVRGGRVGGFPMGGTWRRPQVDKVQQHINRSREEAWQDFLKWLKVGPAVLQAIAAVLASVLLTDAFWQSHFWPQETLDFVPVLLTACVVGGIPLAIRLWRPRQRYQSRSLEQEPGHEGTSLERDWPTIAMYFILTLALAGVIWSFVRNHGLFVLYWLFVAAIALVAGRSKTTRDGQPVPRSRRVGDVLLTAAAFSVGPFVVGVVVGLVHPGFWVWRCIATAGVLILLLLSWQAFRIFRALAASRFWLSWLVAFLLVAPAGFTAVSQMDALLAGRHVAGQASFGLRALVAADARAATDAVGAWYLHARELDKLESNGQEPLAQQRLAKGDEVVHWSVLFDTFLVAPALAGIFFLLLYRMRRRLKELISASSQGDRERRWAATHPHEQLPKSLPEPTTDELKVLQSRHNEYDRMARTGVSLAVLLLVVDWAENMAQLSLVSHIWRTLELGNAKELLPGVAPGASTSWIAWSLVAATVCKLVLLAVLMVLAIAVAVFLGRYYRPEVKEVLQGALLLRGQIVVVICLAAALFLHEQVPDVLRGWDDDRLLLLTGIGLMMWLGLASCLIARQLLWRDTAREPESLSIRIALVAAGALLATGLVALLWFQSWGLLVLAGIFLLVVGASILARRTSLLGRSPWGTGKVALPGLLAIAPNVLLGLAMLRGSIGIAVHERRFETGWESEGILIVVGTVMLISAPAIYNLLNRGVRGWFKGFRYANPTAKGLRNLLVLHAVALIAVYSVLLSGRFWGVTYLIGTVGVLALFLLFVSVILGSLILLSEAWQPFAIFLFLRLRLTPVLSLVLVWAIATTMIAGESTYHDARLAEPSPLPSCELLKAPQSPTAAHDEAGSVTVEDVLDRWKLKNLRQVPATSQGELTAVPLVLVASSGGGIRAAYFTMEALQRIFGHASVDDACNVEGWAPTKADRVLALSGVSGGSLGIASFAAQLADPSIKDEAAMQAVANRVGSIDYLSPTMAWWLFMDTPQALLRMPLNRDRAAILELAWERGWGPHSLFTTGLRQIWFGHPQVPLLLLNGTTVESGCRFNASVLNANVEIPNAAGSVGGLRDIARACLSLEAFQEATSPSNSPSFAATVDLSDFLCSDDGGMDDVRLSTGVLLSARFPGVSPSGGLPWHKRCRKEAEKKTAPTTFVVDGGYLDNSGASTALELWNALEDRVAEHNRRARGSCIVPFFLQIDNGYEEAVGPGGLAKRPLEALAPFATADATRNSRAASARQAAAITFDRPFSFIRNSRDWEVRWEHGQVLDSRYARLSLQAHPGARAPLGWALSDGSRDELKRQLTQLTSNTNAISAAKQWLTSKLACHPSSTTP